MQGSAFGANLILVAFANCPMPAAIFLFPLEEGIRKRDSQTGFAKGIPDWVSHSVIAFFVDELHLIALARYSDV